MKLVRIFCTTLFAVFVLSCDSNRLYEEYKDIPDFEWSQEDILRFEVNITDTLQVHEMFVNVRNTGEYQYSNLWLFIRSIAPNREVYDRKLELKLADKSGQWYGSGFGDLFDLQVPYQHELVFPKKGKYVFEIRQGMYDKKLIGIANLGIRIENKNQ